MIGAETNIELMLRIGLARATATTMPDVIGSWDLHQLSTYIKAAEEQHTLLRTLSSIRDAWMNVGQKCLAYAAQAKIDVERERIRISLECFQKVRRELESIGCSVVLIKTMDHWPDFGSDLDLCVLGEEDEVLKLFKHKLCARQRWRSPGDHLAGKWTFLLPGDPTEIELHINRLGHTGEQVYLARQCVARQTTVHAYGWAVPVPAPEQRVITTVVYRLYRQLSLRACDIMNLAALVQAGAVDYSELRKAAEEAKVWPGVVAYFSIVRECVQPYIEQAIDLPPYFDSAIAQQLCPRIVLRRNLVRLPILGCGAGLFVQQLRHALRSRDFAAAARLSLVPALASIATLARLATGSSGRVW